ncbi:hypothetical protein [Rathayibacter sp. VKM Ac-2754]|uniref:hypothetical protein n=1 Tax=Rathayibacter sp. VKM Ac-2754 TaxID=2609251 RepID=UPI0013593AE8|nr:hypothetical protein [Rathayibacter sp. VKM Ac-2754]MWV57429.1 hypothetical protein [Rathayibacter sp. VKM Ac-2754]
MTWKPLRSSAEEQAVLVAGVPPWLEMPLWVWIGRQLTTVDYRGQTGRNLPLVSEFDLVTRRVEPIVGRFQKFGIAGIESVLDEDETIEFVDFLVFNSQSREAGMQLDGLLTSAGSEWTVGARDGYAGLEKRVPEGVRRAADAAMSSAGHAGPLLSESWSSAFGVNPDYERAYSKAVKAVEAASIPVVMPTNRTATLGTVVGQMRADGDWGLELSREHPADTSTRTVLAMAQTLWTGQNDRHAGQPGFTRSTRAEAEAAVLLAVPLVQWFTSGAIARR